MKISKFRKSLLSAGSGALLALAVGLFAISFTAPVRAGDDPPIDPVENGGFWTCPAPPGGCNLDTCFHNSGNHTCKYIAVQNGADCSWKPDCEWHQ